ncbi:hypothetical protein BC829DRAFT_449600 [Chytridium lagenaria]|nr:hypothetical protein BC829DRAFT_449600 [Chytridium lagenaria]
MASRKKPSLDTPAKLALSSSDMPSDDMLRMQQTLEEIKEEAKQRDIQTRAAAERLEKQNADLHKALQRMTEQVETLNARLEAKDKELTMLRNKISLAPLAPKASSASNMTRWDTDTASEMEEVELGEVPEPKKVRKVLQRRQQLVHDVIATLKESGLLQASRPPPVTAPRGPPPRIFSEHFDTSTPSSSTETSRSFAAAARNISRNSATALDAARIVFRSSFPRSNLTRLENVYFKASVPSGPLWPKRFLIIREALKTLGIKEGVIDMSFVGGSVVHLLVSSEKVDEIEEALRKAGRLLIDFDPLGVPDIPSNQGRSSAELKQLAHDNCVKRLGNLYARGIRLSTPMEETTNGNTSTTKQPAAPKTILKRPASPAQDPRLPLKNRFTALEDDTIMSENTAPAPTHINGLSGKAEAVLAACEEEDLDIMMMVETWMAPTDGGMGTGRRGEGGFWYVLLGKRWSGRRVSRRMREGANTMMEDFDAFLDSMVDRFAGSPIMVVGDFNARMGPRTGDTSIVGNAVRRAWMEAWLDDPEWTRGRGITDFVFMNTLALLLEPDLVVHEDVTLGSDHSLLTIQMTLPGNIWKLPFSRINIQYLTMEGQQAYRDKLVEGRDAVMTRLGLLEVEAAARRVVGTELTWDIRQERVDEASILVLKWLLTAAEDSVGRFQYRGGLTNRGFETPHLLSLRTRAAAAHRDFLVEPPGPRRTILWRQRVDANRIYRAAVRLHKTHMFRSRSDVLTTQPQAAAKVVSCRITRQQRTHCALDPTKMDTYTTYYGTTFGAEPTGTEAPNFAFLDATDPKTLRKVAADVNWLSMDTVRLLVGQVARGKATGEDGIFGEMLSVAGEEVTGALWSLFRLVTMYTCIPTTWREANVALVFKNKGNNGDIANYRPISLISVIRKLFENAFRPVVEKRIPPLPRYCSRGIPRSTLSPGPTAYDTVDRRLLWSRFGNLPAEPAMPWAGAAFENETRDVVTSAPFRIHEIYAAASTSTHSSAPTTRLFLRGLWGVCKRLATECYEWGLEVGLIMLRLSRCWFTMGKGTVVMVEYGLSLRPLTPTELAPIDAAQTNSLRSLFSVSRSTSTAALHLITNLVPIRRSPPRLSLVCPLSSSRKPTASPSPTYASQGLASLLPYQYSPGVAAILSSRQMPCLHRYQFRALVTWILAPSPPHPPSTFPLITTPGSFSAFEKSSWASLSKDSLTCPTCKQTGTKWSNRGVSGDLDSSGVRRLSSKTGLPTSTSHPRPKSIKANSPSVPPHTPSRLLSSFFTFRPDPSTTSTPLDPPHTSDPTPDPSISDNPEILFSDKATPRSSPNPDNSVSMAPPTPTAPQSSAADLATLVVQYEAQLKEVTAALTRMQTALEYRDSRISQLEASLAAVTSSSTPSLALPTPPQTDPSPPFDPLTFRKSLLEDVMLALREAGVFEKGTTPLSTSRPVNDFSSRRTFTSSTSTTSPPDPTLPRSYAQAARSIAQHAAAPEDASRIVFRHTYPTRSITRIDNIYFKGSPPKGDIKRQRFVVVREALRTLGIKTGVIDMNLNITTRLRRHGFLLEDFDPLALPAHRENGPDSPHQLSLARTNCIRRLAILLSRSGSLKADAITRPFADDIALEATTLAPLFISPSPDLIPTTDHLTSSTLADAARFQHLEKETWKNLDKTRLICPTCHQKGVHWTNKGPTGSYSATGTRRLSIRCDGTPSRPCGHSGRLTTILNKQKDSDFLDIGQQLASAHQQLSTLSRSESSSLRQPKQPPNPSPQPPTTLDRSQASKRKLADSPPSTSISRSKARKDLNPSSSDTQQTRPISSFFPSPLLIQLFSFTPPSDNPNFSFLFTGSPPAPHPSTPPPPSPILDHWEDMVHPPSSTARTEEELRAIIADYDQQLKKMTSTLDKAHSMIAERNSLLAPLPSAATSSTDADTTSMMRIALEERDARIAHLEAALAAATSTPPTHATLDSSSSPPSSFDPQSFRKSLLQDVMLALREAGILEKGSSTLSSRPVNDFSSRRTFPPLPTPPLPQILHQPAATLKPPDLSLVMMPRLKMPHVLFSAIPTQLVKLSASRTFTFKGSCPKGTIKRQRFVIVREALRTLGISSGVIDMSFVGSSVIHILVDPAELPTITATLRRHGLLLENFDPLAVPAHRYNGDGGARPSSSQIALARTNCIRRLAILLSRSGSIKNRRHYSFLPADVITEASQLAATFRIASIFNPSVTKPIPPTPAPDLAMADT